MKLLDYYAVSHYRKLVNDPAMDLCQNHNEIRLRVNELTSTLYSKSSIDFTGDSPKMDYDKRIWGDLKRFRARRGDVLKQISRIEDFCSKNGLEYTSMSEYEFFKGQLSISKLRFDDEVNKFVFRLKKKFSSQIPATIATAREHLGDGLTDTEYIRYGIISESRKLRKWFKENNTAQKNLKKFEDKLPEFEELIKKVCGAE